MPTERDLLFAAIQHTGGHLYDRAPPYDDDSQDCVRLGYALGTALGYDLDHADMHLRDVSRPFSPVEAWVNAGGAVKTTHPHPGRYHAVQGWRCEHCRKGKCTAPKMGKLRAGHFVIYWEPPIPVAASGFVIQATPSDDWGQPRYWEDHLERFPHVELAVLKLDG